MLQATSLAWNLSDSLPDLRTAAIVLGGVLLGIVALGAAGMMCGLWLLSRPSPFDELAHPHGDVPHIDGDVR